MNWRLAGVAAALVAAFIGGYQYAAALYGEDIAALREDYAERSATLESQYREKESQNAKKLVAAWEARDKALADADSLRDAVDRVRLEADTARRELSRDGATACTAERAKLAAGAEVVAKLAQDLGACSKLASKLAADKDAVVKATGNLSSKENLDN